MNEIDFVVKLKKTLQKISKICENIIRYVYIVSLRN